MVDLLDLVLERSPRFLDILRVRGARVGEHAKLALNVLEQRLVLGVLGRQRIELLRELEIEHRDPITELLALPLERGASVADALGVRGLPRGDHAEFSLELLQPDSMAIDLHPFFRVHSGLQW
ncbi:MAG TPA: hypothetical protein VNO30_19645 [Kofleriaceae bacterium]|nr:hypothetical protein [Kofleriaceae bacterium]